MQNANTLKKRKTENIMEEVYTIKDIKKENPM